MAASRSVSLPCWMIHVLLLVVLCCVVWLL